MGMTITEKDSGRPATESRSGLDVGHRTTLWPLKAGSVLR